MRIGVDLGGTKIEVVALDTDGAELLRRREPTPPDDYDGIIALVTQLVRSIEEELGEQATVGVGHPGALSPATGVIKNSNSVVLNGRPLDKDLEAALARPLRLANDADCFTLSEASDGAAAGAETAFGVIVGTGVGGGLVIGGALVRGPNAITGEWGHNPLPWPRPDELPGPACYCGRRGCIETFLSGPGFAADHERTAGIALEPGAIVELAAEGEAAAMASVDRYTDRLARGLASIINVIDPAVIVLGGGMSKIEALYREVPDRWHTWVFSDRVDTRLVQARHGDASGVRGAARLWPV